MGLVIVFDEDFTLYSVDEVAKLLGISRSRTQAYIRGEVLAAVHHGRRLMVAADEVERFREEFQPARTRSSAQLSRKFRPPSRPAPEKSAG